MGWPLTTKEYGGAWIYGSKDNVVSLGFVTALDYPDPRLDPQRVLQEFKKHPFIAQAARRRQDDPLRREVDALRRMVVDPAGCGRWLDDPRRLRRLSELARLKGIHLAIKSGMLAAETAFDALKKNDSSAATLGDVPIESRRQLDQRRTLEGPQLPSGIRKRILPRHVPRRHSSNYRRPRSPRRAIPTHAGYQHMKKLSELPGRRRRRSAPLGPAKGDGKLTFDKLTDLYHSGTKHEEDQPAHLVIHDTNICNERCVKEFGSPCQNFCPANVYEMLDDASQPNGKRISLNPSNCVHCKTCDIADPYQIITWVPPKVAGDRTTMGCEKCRAGALAANSRTYAIRKLWHLDRGAVAHFPRPATDSLCASRASQPRASRSAQAHHSSRTLPPIENPYLHERLRRARPLPRGQRGVPPPVAGENRVVFFGDSVTEGWPIESAFPGKPYVNRGISGQTTSQMLLRLREDVINLGARAVVILAGTNDIAGNTGPMSLEEIEANYASLAELARAAGYA